MKPALGAAALATSAVILVGCGGPPEDASSKEFCAQLRKVNAEKTWKAARQEVADLGDLGTPRGISKEARAGFLALVRYTEDAANREALVKKVQTLDKDERKRLDAFDAYVAKTCAD